MARTSGVLGFPESADSARRLADALGLPCHIAEVHRFPDGESLVRLPVAFDRTIVYRSLDRPNDKLVELALAASVLRRQGAGEISLIAPYLAYMRQDAIFRPGEPVSQAAVGGWLAGLFDGFIAVEPHLHRTSDLSAVFAGRPATALSAALPVAEHLKRTGVSPDTVILGPDEESTPLARSVAEALGLTGVAGHKVRHGDRDVTVALPEEVEGRPVVIIDDVISSGATILACVHRARDRGCRVTDVIGIHALHTEDMAKRFAADGLRVISCDGVPHPSNGIPLAPLLADACRRDEV